MRKISPKDTPRSAIVTGASSGIGLATAIELAGLGYSLLLAARRIDRLEELAQRCRQMGVQAWSHPTDVRIPEQVEAMVRTAFDRFGRIDVMVNNAGVGLLARVDQTTDRQMREIFDVNFFGVFNGCRAVAPIMKRQRSGHIFNVSSVAGKRGTPFHGAYCATKFAMVGLDDSLRVELAPWGIRVTTVCPVLTQTEFFDNSEQSTHTKMSFRRFKKFMPPQAVARSIVLSIGKNRPQIVLSAGGKFLSLISALSPRLTDLLMRAFYADVARRMGLPGQND